MAVKPTTTPLASQKSTLPPASSLSSTPKPSPPARVAAAIAPIPAPPVKILLEASIKKTVKDRRDVLAINLRKENEDEVKREEEVRLGKERIALLEAEMTEIDAFLARS